MVTQVAVIVDSYIRQLFFQNLPCVTHLHFLSLPPSLPPSLTPLPRSGYFTFTGDKSLYGIALYRYSLPRDELASANQDPGFYANGPNGVLNLSAVFEENAPVFASKPHFLDADKSYRENVIGMDPVRSLHDSYLDVEPITGEWGI